MIRSENNFIPATPIFCSNCSTCSNKIKKPYLKAIKGHCIKKRRVDLLEQRWSVLERVGTRWFCWNSVGTGFFDKNRLHRLESKIFRFVGTVGTVGTHFVCWKKKR
jgi:hypothetical protein